MAYVKISELTAATSVLGTDEFEVNQSGTSKKVTAAQIAAYTGGGGGGASYQVGDQFTGTSAPTTGTWLEVGKYYSKAAYPTLASVLGNVPDVGSYSIPQNNLDISSITGFTTAGFYNYSTTGGSYTFVMNTNGFIYRSSDGINWNKIPSPIVQAPTSIRYLNGILFLVATNIFASTDYGQTWTTVATLYDQGNNLAALYDIAYGAGVYVAVGRQNTPVDNRFYYSSDLVTWTPASGIGSVGSWSSVVYANSIFVATNTSGGPQVATSTDGINWTLRTVGSNVSTKTTVANNTFFLFSSATTFSYSTNGTSWTNVTIDATFSAYDVAYDGTTYSVVGTSSNGYAQIYTSTNLSSWTSAFTTYGGATGQGGRTFQAISWSGSEFVAVGLEGLLARSTNGSSWTESYDVSYSNFYWVAPCVGSRVVAVGRSGCITLSSAGSRVYFGNLSWNLLPGASTAPYPRCVAYDATAAKYVAVMRQRSGTNGNSGGAILYSSDGDVWTPAISPSAAGYNHVFAVNGNYVALGGTNTSTSIAYSSNGTSWSASSSGLANPTKVAYGNSTYVVVGTAGTVATSSNLAAWTSRTSGTSNDLNDLIYANSLFVAVGAGGTIITSSDGVTWSAATSGTTNALYRVLYANSLFVAVGASGTIVTSSNGTTWTAQSSSITTAINDIVWNGTVYAACGASGRLLISSNGTSWTLITSGYSDTFSSITASGSRIVAVSGTVTSQTVYSTDNGTTWFRGSTALPSANNHVNIAYVGSKFIAVSTAGVIQSSSNGTTWKYCPEYKLTISSITRAQKINSIYFLLTSSGFFTSSDGLSFTACPNTAMAAIAVAYGNSKYVVLMGGGSSPETYLTSTDGINWEVGSCRATSIFGTSAPAVPADMVFCLGNFIVPRIPTAAAYGLFSNLYTSTDGVSWTERHLPLSSAAAAIMGTNGTIVALVYGGYIYTSSDGGVTWVQVNGAPSSTANLIYSNGFWIASPYMGTSLNLLINRAIPAFTANPMYVTSDYVVSFIGNVVNILYKTGNIGFMKTIGTTPIANGLIPLSGANTKPLEVRGSTLLVPMSGNGATQGYPYLLGELSLYSYDTSTTFWIPPSGAAVVGKTFVYAGP